MIKQLIYSIILFFMINPVQGSQKTMRVLFCLRRFPTNTAFFIINQIVEFIKQGHEVTIYTTNFDADSININHHDIIQYNLLEKTFTELPEKKDYDVILCQSAFLAPHIIELRKQNKLSGKLIMFVREAFKGELIEQSEEIFSNVDLVMPVCEYFKKRLIEFGCQEDKIIVLHSAIDVKKFYYKKRERKKNEPIRLMTTSRLNEKKGIHYTIQAIKRIIKKYPNIEYTVFGEGKYRPILEKLIKKLGLRKIVNLAGWKTPNEVVAELDKAHIFILASAKSSRGHEEGIPNALMEACAMGMPIISTYHAGIPELIIDKKSGLLIPERDIKALAKKIDYLIRYPKLWKKMGLVGRSIVEKHFDRDIVNKKLIHICLDLVQGKIN